MRIARDLDFGFRPGRLGQGDEDLERLRIEGFDAAGDPDA